MQLPAFALMHGHLKQKYRRCRNRACPCHHDPLQRHGPYWTLVWWEDGRKRERYLSADHVDAVRALLDERRQVRRHLRHARENLAWLHTAAPPAAPTTPVAPRPSPPANANPAHPPGLALWKSILQATAQPTGED